MRFALAFESKTDMASEWRSVSAVAEGDTVKIKREHSKCGVCETETATVPAAEFIDAFNKLHTEEWEDSYSASVFDGEAWMLHYITDDGQIRHIGGLNAYPENYDGLMKLLY